MADVQAMDRATGAILSPLNTSFGASHVVDGAYHSGRQTLSLVQDGVPAAADRNRIAEINPRTGAVLNTFQIGATFDVNFGDLEVCNATGNLLVVGSDETRIGEYAPTGALIAYHALPPTVTSPSAIAINEQTGHLWVGSNASSGQIQRLTGGPCAATPVPALSGSAPFLLLGRLVTIAGIGRART